MKGRRTVNQWWDGAAFAFDASYTQNNVAATAITVDFAAGTGGAEYTDVTYSVVGTTLGAGRALTVTYMDTNNVQINLLDSIAAFTQGQILTGPFENTYAAAAASTVNIIGYNAPLIVSSTDKIRFNAAACAQNDVLRIKFRCRILNRSPSRVNVNAGIAEAIQNSENNTL